MIRRDILYPFAIDAASGQAAQTDYASHVDQMIRQVLLTDPGERVCLPTFGAGLRRLLFAPMNSSLGASTKLIVTQALNQWLGDQITVQDVTVATSTSSTGGHARSRTSVARFRDLHPDHLRADRNPDCYEDAGPGRLICPRT